MKLTKSLKNQITAHAIASYPKECCGVLTKNAYIPCENVASDPFHFFEIDGECFLELAQSHDIVAIVHSHPDGEPELSEPDRTQMALHGYDWLVVSVGKTDKWQVKMKMHAYSDMPVPLLGRDYHHGVQDCYSLVRDYYKRELELDLPDFARVDDWWEDEHHEPLYQNNFEKAGFVAVDDLQKHDVILCRVGRTHHINHALIYLDDGKLQSENTPDCVGNGLILHHPHGRLSVREMYGEGWQKRTALIVRHKSLCQITTGKLC